MNILNNILNIDIQHIPTQELLLNHPLNIRLYVKRLDLIHPFISGNKLFKLKYNLQHVIQKNYRGILSFGGAYSNHISALAYVCHTLKLDSIAIIRGEELKYQALNPLLQQAQQHGMYLHFVSRDEYRLRHDDEYLQQLQTQYPDYFILPEGANNQYAIQGCQEILTPEYNYYDVVCCAVGTAGTIKGLISSDFNGNILGFSALKGDFLAQEIKSFTDKHNWRIIDDYCMGGYAKSSKALEQFIMQMQQEYQLPLDRIYTAKMFYGIFDLIQQGYFKANSRILAIHSGGLHHHLKHDLNQQA